MSRLNAAHLETYQAVGIVEAAVGCAGGCKPLGAREAGTAGWSLDIAQEGNKKPESVRRIKDVVRKQKQRTRGREESKAKLPASQRQGLPLSLQLASRGPHC